jgi:hypothetical protein
VTHLDEGALDARNGGAGSLIQAEAISPDGIAGAAIQPGRPPFRLPSWMEPTISDALRFRSAPSTPMICGHLDLISTFDKLVIPRIISYIS